MSVFLPHHLSKPVSKGSLRRWLRAAFRTWQRRKMLASLSALDDRTLHDIGLHRTEIAHAVETLDGAETRIPFAALMPRGKTEQRPVDMNIKGRSSLRLSE